MTCASENYSDQSKGIPFRAKIYVWSVASHLRSEAASPTAPQNAARARVAAPSPLTHCQTRAQASAAPNDARTQAKKQVVSQDDFQAKANHRARAPRPARRRWRRSVRAGVYVGRASRLRRRASRAPRTASPRSSPPPPPPSSTEAPTAAPTVPGWRETASKFNVPFKTRDIAS